MTASWRSLILRIGERCPEYGGHADAEEHIETCCTYLNQDIRESENDILSFLMKCIEQLPHKMPLYGTLIGLINAEDSDFALKVVQQTHDHIQEALDTEDCNKIRILIRFLAVLTSNNVIPPASFIEVLETLLSGATMIVDDEKGNTAWQPRADFYVFCIMASLPWAGHELLERAPEELEHIIAGVEAYLSLRKSITDVSFSPIPSSKESGQDHLLDLWTRVKNCQENGWKVDSVPRPHLAFEAKLATCQSHDLGPISCPDPPQAPDKNSLSAIGKQRQEAEQRFPRRIRRVQIFPPSKTDECMTSIDRFIVEEYILDVLFFLNGRRKECAAYLAGLPVPFRYEYLMAETIFSQLFLLPKPPFKPIYYTVVIIDICKALPGAFPTVVAGAVRALFSKISELDVECRTRLIHWFSHHLSNFQFVWPWEEWADIAELPKWSPQRYFVEEVLEKEIRLSYFEKIKQSLEGVTKLVEMLPPKGTPYFKYTTDNQDGCSENEMLLSTELTAMVKSKKTAKDIQSWVEDKILPSLGQKAAIEIVVQTLFYLGSKSFTHMVTVLERYGQVLSKLASDQSLQVFLIQEVSKVWQNSVQMTVIAIDRMMGYRIISNLAIVSWVFSSENVEKFHISDCTWEILRNTISKTVNRTVDLRKEIVAAQKVLDSAKGAVNKALANLETAKSVLDSADTEDMQKQARAKAEWMKSILEKKRTEEVSAQEALEAKEALLSRALKEQENLFANIFKSFCSTLTERLEKNLLDVNNVAATEYGSAMDVDATNGDGDGKTAEPLKDDEATQWQMVTLGQLSAITRQYATEIWEHREKLDADVFNGHVHSIVLKTINSCLTRA